MERVQAKIAKKQKEEKRKRTEKEIYGEEGRVVLIENSGIRRGIKHRVLD